MSIRQKLRDTGHHNAEAMADMVEFGCKAPATIQRYKAVLQKFQEYKQSLSEGAELDATIVAFLLDRYSKSPSGSRLAKAAILWDFEIKGVSPNPAASPMVAMAIESIARAAPAQVHRSKAPPSLVRRIVENASQSGTPADLRFAAFSVVAFAGFYRPMEALKLKKSDLYFLPDGLRVEVHRSKRNQKGPPESVWIASGSQGSFCPVSYLKKWMDTCSPESQWLFPVFNATDKHWSYNALRNHIKAKINQGLLPPDFSAHSFRGGAATAAAEQGIPVDAIARAGRWNNVTSTAPYIKRSRKVLQGADSILSQLW